MKLSHIVICTLITLVILTFSGCGSNDKVTSVNDDNDTPDSTFTIEDLRFGTDDTFEAVTWNLETFPKANNTATLAATMIDAMDVDFVAFQEIEDSTAFNTLVAGLEGWHGWRATSAQYDINLAVAYSEAVTLENVYEIYTHNSREFPRAPLVAEIRWRGRDIVLIDLHLKALGDNHIDESDSWDEEVRRRDAVNLLKEWIDDNHPQDRVIALGDWNDQLQESQSTNVFWSLLQSDDYLFADLEIAETGNIDEVSYPIYASHLDHILISDELIPVFQSGASEIHIFLIEDALDGGWNEYEDDLSDHRAVGIKLDF